MDPNSPSQALNEENENEPIEYIPEVEDTSSPFP